GLQARKNLDPSVRKQKERIICDTMISILSAHHTIAFYYPIKDEVNIRPAIQYALHNGKTVCLPVIREGTMFFSGIRDLQSLRTGMYNIPEPAFDPIPLSEIDLVFVPLTSFDDRNNRTGYGKGYYDAVLSSMHNRIGVAFIEQKADSIETDVHDIALDGVIYA
ncbi:MAG: 5-formyltetrahydrofolate cyclo-ligase, partial [Bulleidia sp.]